MNKSSHYTDKMVFTTQKIYGSIIYSSENRLLIVQGRKTGKWSFPKGHKMEGETAHECSLRETYEETGLIIEDAYIEELQLAAGKYFVYKLSYEPALISYDTDEIMNACWVSLESLRTYLYNCDIRSYIMQAHDLRHNKMYLYGHYNLDDTYYLLKKKRLEEKRTERQKKCREQYAKNGYENYYSIIEYY